MAIFISSSSRTIYSTSIASVFFFNYSIKTDISRMGMCVSIFYLQTAYDYNIIQKIYSEHTHISGFYYITAHSLIWRNCNERIDGMRTYTCAVLSVSYGEEIWKTISFFSDVLFIITNISHKISIYDNPYLNNYAGSHD